MTGQLRRMGAAVLVATAFWFYMFSPWTQGRPNFWLVMSLAAMVLSSLCLAFTPDRKALFRVEKPFLQLVLGVVIALALWGVFWTGDKVSALIFDFARAEVDSVYAMKTGLPQWGIALLLIFLIGPAEELFWRGYVQRTLAAALPSKRAADIALVVTVAVYSLVHIWSFNFMLVMAAMVAGAVWGLIYRLKPELLPALVISHALWDALVFVIIPI